MHFKSLNNSRRKNISTGTNRENRLQISLTLQPLRAILSNRMDPKYLSKTRLLMDPLSRIHGTGFMAMTVLLRKKGFLIQKKILLFLQIFLEFSILEILKEMKTMF